MCPMRMVESFRAPYPEPMVQPACFSRADDLLGAVSFGHLETRHGPAAAPFLRQVGKCRLLAPLLHAAAHRIVPSQRPSAPPSRLDPAELGLESEQQRDRGVLVG